jgi:hypothetical protein
MKLSFSEGRNDEKGDIKYYAMPAFVPACRMLYGSGQQQ